MPLGHARKFVLEPHGYYDTAAEVYERTRKAARDSPAVFTRSKIRCTTIAEWMELCDAATGKPIWRIESRFGDRGVYAPQVESPTKGAFVTAMRMYREYEKEPTLMLVHRDQMPSGITDPMSNKVVDVFMCSQLRPAASSVDPDAELESFRNDNTHRQLMPDLVPNKPVVAEPDADESFFFARQLPGEDTFSIQTNATFTQMTLSAVTDNGTEPGQFQQKRVLANLKRTVTSEPRSVEVDSALDPALIIGLFAAVDQMLISHDAIDYDVEWPNDYAYTFDQISTCFGPRKPVRKAKTYLGEEEPANEVPKEASRGICFDLQF